MDNLNEIKLSKEDLFALSSDVRASLLKLIDKKSYTLTELSYELGLSKSTVHQHIAQLIHSEFIEADESRKWHPYTLTIKAKRILHPDNRYKIILLLGATFCTAAFGGIMISIYFKGFMYQGSAHIQKDPLFFLIGESLLFVTLYLLYRAFSILKTDNNSYQKEDKY
ncbi:putative transcriptional regulator [Methanomicrobium sp. W14]|uniref:winged helix-turn-helix domain-containing protein n=1 Tax=Methanomicrobium sp. W14 TaxID=2817839 RepID=UPI001AE57672|nr:winged helix-turn-helix domain-containing protein [Methanomicrobium sp. W14]MBP2133869.1 putative transcriptional regulator [Methanomicrobium sp. W14]